MGAPPPQNGPEHKRVSKMEQISTSPGCNAVLSWGSAVLQRRILVRLWTLHSHIAGMGTGFDRRADIDMGSAYLTKASRTQGGDSDG